MKKNISFLLVLIHILCNGQTQEEITFRVEYQPETKYYQTTVQRSRSETKYSGTDKIIQLLKRNGVQNPTIIDDELKIESVLTTGKTKDSTSFPLQIEFVKTTNNEISQNILEGAVIYGHGTNGNMPTLDSIISDMLDEDFKQKLLEATQNTFSQLTFPNKKLKPGESFSQASTLSIPIAGLTVEMNINTEYKLLNITNGIAFFDVHQIDTMHLNTKQYSLNAAGYGTGQLLFDVSNKYLQQFQLETIMEMNLKNENISLRLLSNSTYFQTTIMKKD